MTNQENKHMLVPQGLDIQDENNQPLMALRIAEKNLLNTETQTLELGAENISQLNHFLSLIPSSVSAAAGNSKQLMTCSFDYSKLIQAKDGSGAIGGVFAEGSTQIGAQARFHEATGLKTVVNTGLLLNIASQALAQKHLADINERLKSIEDQVKGIQEFLEQSRLAKIQVFQEHLQRIGVMLKRGEAILPDTLTVLALKTQEVRSEVTHIRRDLEKAHQKIKEFNSSSWFGSSEIRISLQEKIKRISYLQREYMLGMQCLLVANLVLYIKHNGNKEFVLAGDEYLAELQHEHGLLAQWETTTRSVAIHLNKMKPIFESAKSTQANTLLVESNVTQVQKMIARDSQQVRQLQQQIVDAQNPRILLEVENGHIVRGLLPLS